MKSYGLRSDSDLSLLLHPARPLVMNRKTNEYGGFSLRKTKEDAKAAIKQARTKLDQALAGRAIGRLQSKHFEVYEQRPSVVGRTVAKQWLGVPTRIEAAAPRPASCHRNPKNQNLSPRSLRWPGQPTPEDPTSSSRFSASRESRLPPTHDRHRSVGSPPPWESSREPTRTA